MDNGMNLLLGISALGAHGQGGGGTAWTLAWDGQSTPDVTKIPAGVTVTYSGTTYTGTLAASSLTANSQYLVYAGTSGATTTYNVYITTQSGTSYSWTSLGGTGVDTSLVYTNESTSSLVTMGDLRTRINSINTAGKHVFFDMHTFISGAYVCLITLTETTTEGTTTYYCEINDLLNNNVYTTYTGYALTDTISAFITDATVKGGYRSIKLPAGILESSLINMINAVNTKGEHVFFDMSSIPALIYENAYVCTVSLTLYGTSGVMLATNLITGKRYSFNVYTTGTTSINDRIVNADKHEAVDVMNYVERLTTYDDGFSPNEYKWLGERGASFANRLKVSASSSAPYGSTSGRGVYAECVVAFTAIEDFTLTITPLQHWEHVVGDAVINCVAGKTYEICTSHVGSMDSQTIAISYRGW